MNNEIRLQFDSSIEKLTSINDSFSSASLRICYCGQNRNGSLISKQSIERALPTMYNCPVVCNYDVENDTVGGHDIDLVQTGDGDLKIVNLTNAIGVIPHGAKTWWSVIDDSGTKHEYLNTEVILWKRSPAYEKISKDGICSQSMEISVKHGRMEDNVFVIDDFIFTAFCLLGDNVAPCFESAALQMYSADVVSKQFSMMMAELKETFSLVQHSTEVDIYPANTLTEGGDDILEQITELMSEYGLSTDMLDFNVEDFSIDELREKFEAIKTANQNGDVNPDEQFALTELFKEELITALSSEIVETCFGEMCKYWYIDYDSELNEVYCYDTEDWKVYGLPFSMNGDNIFIDFACKKRKKFAIVDFDEGEQPTVFSALFTAISSKYSENESQWIDKYSIATNTIASMEDELKTLRQFKVDTENAITNNKRDEVLAQFEDLAGVDAFDLLKEHKSKYSLEDLEEKCYAIRGRHSTPTKCAYELKNPKLVIEKFDGANEPYGGVFSEYGISPKQSH